MRQDNPKQTLVLCAFGLIPVVWAALLTAPAIAGGLPEILQNLTAALNNPLNIQWCEDSLKTVLIFIAAYGMGIGVPSGGGTGTISLGSYIWPSNDSDYITSFFGTRVHPIYGDVRHHNGIDIGVAYGRMYWRLLTTRLRWPGGVAATGIASSSTMATATRPYTRI